MRVNDRCVCIIIFQIVKKTNQYSSISFNQVNLLPHIKELPQTAETVTPSESATDMLLLTNSDNTDAPKDAHYSFLLDKISHASESQLNAILEIFSNQPDEWSVHVDLSTLPETKLEQISSLFN